MKRSAGKPRFSLEQRSAGALFHLTSLPGPHGCGDLGPEARVFARFLRDAGQRWWQMLPVGPIGPGDSPYSSDSAFACGPHLISLRGLVDDGLLKPREIHPPKRFSERRADYAACIPFREACLRRACERFTARRRRDTAYEAFREANRFWLNDYALYRAIKRRYRLQHWIRWPAELRERKPAALRQAAMQLRDECEYERFVQYLFARQWREFRRDCEQLGVGLIGDIPIFVSHDSADVWANPELFQLDNRGRPIVVSGCPPDDFSRTGQLWGHPIYRWPTHLRSGFRWWVERFRLMFELFHAVRVDHFIGFHHTWQVPGRHRTALRGVYRPTPGRELLTAVFQQLDSSSPARPVADRSPKRSTKRAAGRVQIIAEDLGHVTPEVWALRDEFELPGMRVMQWAFGDGARFDQPHNHPPRSAVYTGTHDHDTVVGWFRKLPRGRHARGRDGLTVQQRLWRYAGFEGAVRGRSAAQRDRDVHWTMTRLCYQSPAQTAIIQVQDWLGLGSEARMNTPATVGGNWHWRVPAERLNRSLARRLRELAATYERA